jgi:hypothetical protein
MLVVSQSLCKRALTNRTELHPAALLDFMATAMDEHTEDLLQALEVEIAILSVDIKALERKREQLKAQREQLLTENPKPKNKHPMITS